MKKCLVGFEDTELSLRLFQKGIKVGGCGIISLIHDHPKPENNADKTYEKNDFQQINYENQDNILKRNMALVYGILQAKSGLISV